MISFEIRILGIIQVGTDKVGSAPLSLPIGSNEVRAAEIFSA